VKIGSDNLVSSIKNGSVSESLNLCVVLSYLLKTQNLNLPKDEIKKLIQTLAAIDASLIFKEV